MRELTNSQRFVLATSLRTLYESCSELSVACVSAVRAWWLESGNYWSSRVPKENRTISAAMSTSQKHRDFVAEPMGDKPVGCLAGIGDTLGGRLEEKGFDKAYVVLGQFLVLKKDEELFREWLKDVCNANVKQARDCHSCLKEWCDAFL